MCHSAQQGRTTGGVGTILAAQLYGKDEDNSFGFKQADIDKYLVMTSDLMSRKGIAALWELGRNHCRGISNLCISDSAKQLLINNEGFVPHLIDGLLLSPSHPRSDTPEEIKAIVQRDYADCIHQLSLFPPGCEALKDSDVIAALDVLVDSAWTEEAKDSAKGALMQLTDRHREGIAEVDMDSLHIMMSYQWDSQEVVKLIVLELKARGYLVWFDLERMKGSVMDAMSEAVEVRHELGNQLVANYLGREILC